MWASLKYTLFINKYDSLYLIMFSFKEIKQEQISKRMFMWSFPSYDV